jgi:hypothetical protein
LEQRLFCECAAGHFRATSPGVDKLRGPQRAAFVHLTSGARFCLPALSLARPIAKGFINLNVTGTFQYLVAQYDDPNGGVGVWNISSLTGTIEIYMYAKPEKVNGHLTGNLLGTDHAQQGYFRITGYTLLNPLSVPDGGVTVMLLGGALGALGMARRFIRR